MIRIVIYGLIFAAAGVIWEGFSSLVFRAGFLGEAVPPITAFLSLLLLLPLRSLMRGWFARLRLSDGELLATYGFLTIAATVVFINGLRGIVDMAAIPHYGDPNDAMLNFVRPYWPAWIAPTDPQVIRWLYQGSPTGQVPWAHWIVPIACLTGLLTLILTATTSLYAMLARRWIHEERLAYPIADLASSMVRWEEGRNTGITSVFRTRLFWAGAITVFFFNLIWIVPAIFAPGNVPPVHTNLNAMLPVGPLQAGYVLFIRYNPMVLALGILVPADVLFSTWFSTLLMKVQAVVLAWMGYGWDTTFFLPGRQGFGGYLILAGSLLFLAAPTLRAAIQSLFGSRRLAEAQEEAWYMLFLLAAALGLVWAMTANEMPAWMAFGLVAMLLIIALVNGRIRTQVGVPTVYLHGGGALQGARGLLFLLGGGAIASGGPAAITSLVVFSSLDLSTTIAPYQADGFRLAEKGGISRPRWVVLSILAVVFAAVFGFIVHLSIYYRFGGEYLNWPPSTFGIVSIVRDLLPQSLSPSRWGAVLAGALTTLLCILGQRAWHWWPIHPIGFITAGAIGGYIIGQFFLAWLIKAIALRYGGLGSFLQLKEFFLGVALGHLVIAGTWAILGMLGFGPTDNFLFLFY